METDPRTTVLPDTVLLPPRGKKRGRQAEACEPCRTKKIRCGREQPICVRCARSRTSVKCVYEEDAAHKLPQNKPLHISSGEDTMDNLPPKEVSVRRFNDVFQSHQPLSRLRKMAWKHDEKPKTTHKLCCRGAGTATRSQGTGIFVGIMSKSHDVKPFSRALAEAYPVLVRLHQDLDIIKKSHRLLKPREVSHTPDMVSLMSLLPAKARALELLRIYMDYIEPSYLVINKCVFYRQLAGLWPENVTANSPVSANFIAQFLLVMACALSIVDLQEPTAISGMAKARRPQALLWIQESEKWLHDDGPGKSDADHFRVQCLVVLAKKIHHLQHQHCWLATSALVQAAMMAGYNRDPSGHHKISYLAIENRWRLWRTILRLHLEACFALGMPPSVLVNEWDKDPDNIGKAMLDRLYGPSPNPYYVDGPTLLNAEQSLYEPLSLHLQLLVAHAMNDPHLQCTPTYNETLRTSLRELHSILRESTLPSSEQAATHWTQIQPYCQLQICRLELALSAPSPDNGDPASDGIWQAVYDSSFELLGVFLESTHKAEEPHHRQTLLCTMWTPIVQSCKGLLASLPVASNDAHHHKPRSPQARHATTAFDRIEATLAHLEPQAIVDLKRTKDLCHLLTYYAYIRCRLAASALEKARIEKETVDRIAGVSYKIVANHTSSSQFDAGGGPAAQHGLGDGEQGVNFVLDEGFQWDNYLGDFAWS